jgi:hypothetical protein
MHEACLGAETLSYYVIIIIIAFTLTGMWLLDEPYTNVQFQQQAGEQTSRMTVDRYIYVGIELHVNLCEDSM